MNRFGPKMLIVVAAALALIVAQCQSPAGTRARLAHGSSGPSPYADLDADELHDVVMDLAHAHDQKKGVALWVTVPVVGKTVGPAFKGFYANMGTQQGELLKEIQAWAAAHKMDLTYSYSDDNEGRALKIMEDRQEKLLKADDQADFERDMLIDMFSDYESQISALQALLPRVKDADLKAYLEKSLKVHEEGSEEILGLLRRYKFAG